jgi:hypothetical protein
MFAVTETATDFTGIAGYSYYVGCAYFGLFIVADIKYYYGYLLICLNSGSNGAILKILNVGGSGHNMFAVNQSGNSFTNIQGYTYYVGDASFGSGVTGINVIDGKSFVEFQNGHLLKSNGVAGSGHNLFAVNEIANSFTGVAGYNYYIGEQYF